MVFKSYRNVEKSTTKTIMLNGHSGDNIDLFSNSDGYFVEKSGAKRLIHQMLKQKQFYNEINHNKDLKLLFDVPLIIECFNDEEIFRFQMPFYNGTNILDILEKGNIHCLNTIIDKLCYFIQWEINPTMVLFQKNLFLNKIDDLYLKSNKEIKILLEKFKKQVHYIHPLLIPTGICHGDLTFSNLIFTDKIVLIDFLNTFYDNPLQDIAKLFQEINLKWTLLLDQNRDNTKITIGYNYFRKKLEIKLNQILLQYNIKEPFLFFYLMTLFRLTPYIQNDIIYREVISEVNFTLEKINEFNSTNCG